MSEHLKLAVLIGSTREQRYGGKVGHWFAREARETGQFDVSVIDIAEIELPPLHPTEPTPATSALMRQLADADAFVVVTPEYNHSYPAHLKHAIDQANEEWHAKAVGFVSYGGVSGGLRAVEHLRQVFAELHAVTVRDAVSFHAVWEHFSGDAGPLNPDRSSGAAKTMLHQLKWWATALKEARSRFAYTVS
ncbi:MAG: NADPH-dependent oxidoreductase [Mesorhizobium sp.]|uniref:NADPH-dependent FMN reductase n=1 Tax=Mesorhizobium sp. TaxID=1871066 RepID=UPI000FE755E0|nr:NAD(P)H-dependent oxidoreductase [Mesorhizobium sp.]RWD31626.1 MAG: NADPH-dependent oxidoreductase [Mesorhizobium sp.]TJW70700.1 MAG: NAD(P)H-dependent oxidoreductase [Mesorhizobium sp.]